MLCVQNGILHTMESQGTIRADLLAEEGKIIRIEEHIAPPEQAEILDAAGFHVYPGPIDAHSHIGIAEEKIGT